MSKIITLEQLDNIKRGHKKLVLCGGCFDLLHIGHLYFLQAAKNLGDLLMVALEPDEKVRTLKGKNRPLHAQKERAEMLAAFEIIDYVLLLPGFKTDIEYTGLIKKIKPAVIAVTQYDPVKKKKELQAKLVGGKMTVIPKIKTPSTTQLAKILRIDYR